MMANRFAIFFCLIFSLAGICLAAEDTSTTLAQKPKEDTIVTLLFTNDVESAYDPIPAFWLDDVIIQYFRDHEVVVVPERGRQKDVTPTD